MGPFPQHLLLQLVHVWGAGQGGPRDNGVTVGTAPYTPTPTQPPSPSKRPEKLSVALQRFFFLGRFLASGMSMGWLEGMSGGGAGGVGVQPYRDTAPPPQPPHCHRAMLTRPGWAVKVKFGLQAGGLLERQLEGVLALGGGGGVGGHCVGHRVG